LHFQQIELKHLELLKPYFTENPGRLCDGTLGAVMMWRDLHAMNFAIEDGILYLRADYTPEWVCFLQPRGNNLDLDDVLARLTESAKADGRPAALCSLSGEFLEGIRARYPDAKPLSDRRWHDYLYNASDIVSLAGRRYSGQRNHINKFKNAYENWRFVPIDGENRADVRAFIDSFRLAGAKEDYPAYYEGNVKALEVLDNLGRFGQVGGALYIGDTLAGCAMGEIVGDTLYVHTEKALTQFQGSYPMLVQQFAAMYADCDRVKYINREEDDGVEGLRTSKLSYHPCALLEKYTVLL
jgi:hypothetical protein